MERGLHTLLGEQGESEEVDSFVAFTGGQLALEGQDESVRGVQECYSLTLFLLWYL